jgi:DNA-binding NtrC family response regulator
LQPFLTVGTRSDFDLRRYSDQSLREFKEEMEREFIVMKLKEHDWNISRASSALGIERNQPAQEAQGL